VTTATKDRIKRIYEALPKLDCGLCGYGNCGRFARAVAEGKASPFGCRQNPWAGYRISEVIGAKAPRSGYGLSRPGLSQRPEPLSPALLREEMRGLSVRLDTILTRIEKLKRHGYGQKQDGFLASHHPSRISHHALRFTHFASLRPSRLSTPDSRLSTVDCRLSTRPPSPPLASLCCPLHNNSRGISARAAEVGQGQGRRTHDERVGRAAETAC